MKRLTMVLLACLPLLLAAQRERILEKPENRGNAILVHFGYGLHGQAADLADRFGASNSLVLAGEYIKESNIFYGAQMHLHFGQLVNEDPVSILRNADGDIVGNNMGLAMFALRQRGYHAGVYAGKLFPFGKKRRAGLRTSFGLGYMWHKIRVQDDGNSILQITNEYAAGYDRLTGGIAATQFIGYQYIPLRAGLTFFAGIELEEGLTNTKREWDFSEKKKLEGTRLDMRYGLRVGFSLPFHLVKNTEDIYY